MTDWHIGRSFHGHRLEDLCPCVKAPCGLAIHDEAGNWNAGCPEHDMAEAKTIRQSHAAENCPETNRSDSESFRVQLVQRHTLGSESG